MQQILNIKITTLKAYIILKFEFIFVLNSHNNVVVEHLHNYVIGNMLMSLFTR